MRSMNSWRDALERLKTGNTRFTAGLRSTQSLLGHLQIKELADAGQRPFAIILSCSDSRVPAELLFDCGFGELFVIRVAGNVLQPSQLASIEFAAKVLGAQLCTVMGHSKCGALQATIDSEVNHEPGFTSNIDALLDLIRPSVRRCLEKSRNDHTPDQILELSIRENIHHTAYEIFDKSPLLGELAGQGRFAISEAYYCLETGTVEFGQTLQGV